MSHSNSSKSTILDDLSDAQVFQDGVDDISNESYSIADNAYSNFLIDFFEEFHHSTNEVGNKRSSSDSNGVSTVSLQPATTTTTNHIIENYLSNSSIPSAQNFMDSMSSYPGSEFLLHSLATSNLTDDPSFMNFLAEHQLFTPSNVSSFIM